jgi:TRAP-type mannitol/chloroaromatic compound transport system permease large subunit
MSETAGMAMLVAVAVLLLVTGLPAWLVLLGVALTFAAGGVLAGVFALPLLTAMPARLLGLLEQDILQALPLYVLMGVLLNRLPLAETLFRTGNRALAASGAGPSLTGLGLGVLLAPMNGAVGASVAMLTRTVQPRLEASGVAVENGAALVCVASTMGVVIPPSLVLILLGDAMMRAHTEATNLTHEAVRIINTQDVFAGALVPATILLVLCGLVAWRTNRGAVIAAGAPPAIREWVTAGATVAFIASLFIGVTLGYLYAVEAAASGAVALFAYGLTTRTLARPLLSAVLRDTMAVTGALFALLLASTMFTLVVRAFGTDRWLAAALVQLGMGETGVLLVVLAIIAACALVLDAFEMIFVVIPVAMPPLLTLVHDATWVAVLTLLILQASFLTPPFGYAVLMVRNSVRGGLSLRRLSRALFPYLAAQLLVLALVLAWPALIWQRNPSTLTANDPASSPAGSAGPVSDDEVRRMLERQLAPPPDTDAVKRAGE